MRAVLRFVDDPGDWSTALRTGTVSPATWYAAAGAQRVVDLKARVCDHITGPDVDAAIARWQRLLTPHLDAHVDGWRDLEWGDDVRLYRYPVGGFFGPHVDTSPPEKRRVHTVVHCLQAPTSGGELIIHNTKEKFEYCAGEVMIFPSKLVHSAAPVLAGDKVVVVGWLASAL